MENKTEIIEGDKLIAEFDGWEKSPYPNTPNKMYKGDSSIHVGNLQYHSSWDWLMPACHKWDSLDNSQIPDWTEYMQLCNELDANVALYEIIPVWEQLVENIQWLNQNSTK